VTAPVVEREVVGRDVAVPPAGAFAEDEPLSASLLPDLDARGSIGGVPVPGDVAAPAPRRDRRGERERQRRERSHQRALCVA
jgi:hypothetical protein